MGPSLADPGQAGEPDVVTVREAAEWLAFLESGDANEADHREFEAWREADITHALAINRLSAIQDGLAGSSEEERATLETMLLRSRRRLGGPLLTVLVLVGVGWVAWRLPVAQFYLADQKTGVGETRTLALQDGSELTLSTSSAVDIDVGEHRRVVRLLRGEVLTHVRKRAPQSFIVETDDGTAAALGTAFTVRKADGATIVAVAESRVRVCPSRADEPHCITLTAGERCRMSDQRVERLSNVLAADVGSWAGGWLSVDDRPVTEVLDELNRWRATPISFNRAELTGLSVSGVFPLLDTDRAAANLTRLLPVELSRSDPAAPAMRRR
jgi:transmembrane sensor